MAKPKHGLPDWGVTAGAQTVYQMNDLGEAVVRLGSPVSFDRRGDVIRIDSFEDGLANWNVYGSAPGGAVYLSLLASRSGLYSVKLIGPSDPALISWLAHSSDYPVRSNLGFEISFSVLAAVGRLRFQVTVWDGTEASTCGIMYDGTAKTLSYYAANGAYTPFATGIDLSNVPTPFYTSKLVVDIVNNQYLRYIFGANQYDLSGIPMYTAPSPLPPHALFQVLLTGLAGSNPSIYVDDYILTQNEPD
jgi:hypothetical protein